jgi:hypothetical protein
LRLLFLRDRGIRLEPRCLWTLEPKRRARLGDTSRRDEDIIDTQTEASTMRAADRISANTPSRRHHPKRVVATPDSAGVQSHPMLRGSPIFVVCAQLHCHDVGGCMEACTNRLSLAGCGAIGPPSPRIQGLVVSGHGVGLQGPLRFPGGFLSFPGRPGAVPREYRTRFSPPSGCTERTLAIEDPFSSPERQRH